jgi:hypothetical protein
MSTDEDIWAKFDKLRRPNAWPKARHVSTPTAATLLRFTMLVLQDPSGRDDEAGHDIIALRNIERIEELRNSRSP